MTISLRTVWNLGHLYQGDRTAAQISALREQLHKKIALCVESDEEA